MSASDVDSVPIFVTVSASARARPGSRRWSTACIAGRAPPRAVDPHWSRRKWSACGSCAARQHATRVHSGVQLCEAFDPLSQRETLVFESARNFSVRQLHARF